MYLKDFRPVSFEVNGKPLVMTDSGLAVDNGITITADTTYQTDDRRSIISLVSNTFKLISGNETNLFDGKDNTTFEIQHDDSIQINELIYEMADPQVVTEITIKVDKFNNALFDIYASNDLLSWTHLVPFTATEQKVTVSLRVSNNEAFKYYKMSSDGAINQKGTFWFMDFEVVDRPSLTTSILNTENGQYTFTSSNLVGQDSHDNGLVEFKIDGVTAISFNATRTIDSVPGKPGNTHFNGYLSTNNSIFCGGSVNGTAITSDGIIISNDKFYSKSTAYIGDDKGVEGRIKMFDTGISDWVDFVIDNNKIYLDGSLYTSGGAQINDNASASTTLYSSSKIVSLIDDFEKVDSYIGAFTQTNNILFDKYNEIDILMGRICEGTATAEEIALVETLDQQLGLLAVLDNNIVEYIDLKLGK